MQYSVAVRNARLDSIQSTVGTTPILTIRSGAMPASCAAANAGTVLATLNLPSSWMTAASNGSKSMSGNWEDSSADAAGTAAHFRIHDSTGNTCHMQGTISMSGGGGDMILDNTNINTGQDIIITSFTLTAGNA